MLNPLLDQILTFLIWEHIDVGRPLKGLLRHIYIENGHIEGFYLYFLGGGLGVIINSNIFEILSPPPGV